MNPRRKPLRGANPSIDTRSTYPEGTDGAARIDELTVIAPLGHLAAWPSRTVGTDLADLLSQLDTFPAPGKVANVRAASTLATTRRIDRTDTVDT